MSYIEHGIGTFNTEIPIRVNSDIYYTSVIQNINITEQLSNYENTSLMYGLLICSLCGECEYHLCDEGWQN